MSVLQANTWTTNSLLGAEITAGAPIKITQVTIPYSTAAGYNGSYQTFENASTANTNQLYSFTYTPVAVSSYIHYMAFLQSDRSANVGAESLYVFINNTAYSQGYHYPRVSSNEPWQPMTQSGVYTNTNGSALTFSIRARNSSGWTQYIGNAVNGVQVLSNTIQIIEIQR